MKTLVIRRGAKLTIRAVAYESAEEGSRDKCATLAFLSEQKMERVDDLDELGALLTLTAEKGPPQNETKFKRLQGTDGLYEFKTKGGLRVLCFWDDGSLIICTHGFVKKQQKTPKQELATASRTKRDYELAKQNGGLTHA
jgi:phage-related protein